MSKGDQEAMFLPPGFRFHPTDEEVITSYLTEKFVNPSFTSRAVGEVDLNKCEPWDLPSKAKMGEKEWYFFCQKDMKYPTGMRTNRATKAGYWKATGKDKEIHKGKGVLVGMKKTLVFYKGRAPKGEKTNWVMHEFRLEGKSKNMNLHVSPKDEWVVCKVFHKKGPIKKSVDTRIDAFVKSLIDPTHFNSNSLPDTSVRGAQYNTNNAAVMGLEDPTQKSTTFQPCSMINTSNQVNNSMPISTQNSSWSLPGSAHDMGYLYQGQAMVRALGGVIDPNFIESKGLPSTAINGSPKLASYAPYPSYPSSTTTGPARNFDSRHLPY